MHKKPSPSVPCAFSNGKRPLFSLRQISDAGTNDLAPRPPRESLPEGVDDGILTAAEISRLDFRGLDLIIIMSLWKVNDKATMMLMTEFYNHLFRGTSKYEALTRAQKYVRQQPGYEDPKYWAGFILLDGIN